MSYSRWLNSSWYMFWATNEFKEKDRQLCEIYYTVNEATVVTFKDLKEDFNGVMREMEAIFYRASQEELTELSIYFNQFYDDVVNNPHLNA